MQCAGDDTERHKDEENIYVVAGESRIDQVQHMLGQCLEARLVCVVLSAPDERGVLIVKPAVGGLRHGRLLLVIAGSATVTVKLFPDGSCQEDSVSDVEFCRA